MILDTYLNEVYQAGLYILLVITYALTNQCLISWRSNIILKAIFYMSSILYGTWTISMLFLVMVMYTTLLWYLIVLKSFLKSESVWIWQLEWSLFQTITASEIFMIIERPIYHASTRTVTENPSYDGFEKL